MSIPQVSWPKYGESKEYAFYRNWQIYSIEIHTIFLATNLIEIPPNNTKYRKNYPFEKNSAFLGKLHSHYRDIC